MLARLHRVGMAAVALACWTLTTTASAGDLFRTVDVATGKPAEGTSKLKWLPYRPSVPEEVRSLRTLTQRQAAKPPTRLVQHDGLSPFADPFGDAKSDAARQDTSQQQSRPDSGLIPLIPPSQSGAYDPAYPLVPTEQETETGPKPGTAAEQSSAPQTLTLAEELGARAPDLDYECPSLEDLKPIGEITYRTTPQSGELPRDCVLSESKYEPRTWAETTFMWKASALCHKPLYFEDVQVERYGHSWGPLVQPVMSGAHFFGNVLALPYKLGMDPPWECQYTLGYYRPGNCAPYMLDPIPLSVRGAAVAGAIWTGGVYAIP